MRNLTRECKGSLPMGRFRTSSTCTEIWLLGKKRWRGKDVRILLPGKISREAMHRRPIRQVVETGDHTAERIGQQEIGRRRTRRGAIPRPQLLPTQGVIIGVTSVSVATARSRVGVGVLFLPKGEDGEHRGGSIVRAA